MNYYAFQIVRRSVLFRAALLVVISVGAAAQMAPQKEQVPTFQVDPAWPKPMPNNWKMGPVCGVAVDKHGNVWVSQRAVDLAHARPGASATPETAQAAALHAPPVLEFAPDGTLLASWGGPGSGYDWPKEVHGMYVDQHDNVWVAGAANDDNQILKFTNKGKFLLQIGHPGQNKGSNDTENLGAPAQMVVDEAANELYVADGYVNHRVIVFNATTGAYKRHWGAYGKRPDDSYYADQGIKPGEHSSNGSKKAPSGPPPPQFDLVHSVRLSKDGLVYVCDRSNNRIQVFKKDGTFLQEAFFANDRLASGSTSDVGFSTDPQQRFLFVVDSTHQHVYVVDRKSLTILSTFGEPGKLPGQFSLAHNMAVDAKGNLFVTESGGARVQKFTLVGTKDAD